MVMKTRARLEIGVSQSPGDDGLCYATSWYVNNNLQLSFTDSDRLPPVVSIDLDFPATVKIVLDGQSIENKVFSLDVNQVTLYIGNVKFKLTEKQAEQLFNEQMHYSTEEDIKQGVEIKFSANDPLQWILDCFKGDMIATFLTQEESLHSGVSLGIENEFRILYSQK